MSENKKESPKNPKLIYELIENLEHEIMALIFAGKNPPENPSFKLIGNNLELKRNPKEYVLLQGLKPETIEKIKKLDVFYVCEMDYDENTKNNKILYAYKSLPEDKVVLEKTQAPEKEAPKQETKPQTKENTVSLKPTSENLAERARLARESIIKKIKDNENNQTPKK